MNKLRFIDLFAGIGGIRKGFELACAEKGFESEWVFTSEIKPEAINVLKQNQPQEKISGDITTRKNADNTEFDFSLAGFPCRAFSAAGKRLGFEDTRGTLFFEVARIIKEKNPKGFILENVEGLVNHDKENSKDKIGKTHQIILDTLEDIGYKVSWKVLNAKYFSVPQERKRIYIVGTRSKAPDLESFPIISSKLSDVLDTGLPIAHSYFIDLVLKNYSMDELKGKSFKDKRGGEDNIHSWDIGLKGPGTKKEKQLLETRLTERRKKKWAEDYGSDWMDGMPWTCDHIKSLFECDDL